MPYREAIEQFATQWHLAGHPVPAGYTHADARPSSPRLRQYQKQRGKGDGRRPAITAPIAALLLATNAFDAAPTNSSSRSPTDTTEDEELPRQLTVCYAGDKAWRVKVVPVRLVANAIEALLPLHPDHIMKIDGDELGENIHRGSSRSE